MTTITKIWSEVHNRNAYYNEDGNRLPEICIMDLANIPEELSSFKVDEIIQIWQWIKCNIEDMIDSEADRFFLVSRRYVDTEIRLISKERSSLDQFRRRILDEAIKKSGLTSKTVYKDNIVIEQGIDKEQFRSILSKFQKDYEEYGPKKEHEDKFLLYSCNSIIIGSFWKEIEKLGESFIFVAHSGVPYMLGFYQTTNNKNIFLTEFHLNGDPYKMYRKNRPGDGFILGIDKNSGLKSPVIIDRSYTGGTLIKLKNKFPNAKTVALFPKTFNSVNSSDYFVFNNKLFARKDIKFSDEEWHLTLLKKSLERKNENNNI
jgi:hypothetical protein